MIKRYYSPSTGGFYDERTHGPREVEGPLDERERRAGKRATPVANPDCLIPADAVEVTADRHAELMRAQADGMEIAPAGRAPVASTRRLDEAERQVRRRARRDNLLAKSDWTQLEDANPPGGRRAWAFYRQALRDLKMNENDWPVPPGREDVA